MHFALRRQGILKYILVHTFCKLCELAVLYFWIPNNSSRGKAVKKGTHKKDTLPYWTPGTQVDFLYIKVKTKKFLAETHI
jgi:hypothetical protein